MQHQLGILDQALQRYRDVDDLVPQPADGLLATVDRVLRIHEPPVQRLCNDQAPLGLLLGSDPAERRLHQVHGRLGLALLLQFRPLVRLALLVLVALLSLPEDRVDDEVLQQHPGEERGDRGVEDGRRHELVAQPDREDEGLVGALELEPEQDARGRADVDRGRDGGVTGDALDRAVLDEPAEGAEPRDEFIERTFCIRIFSGIEWFEVGSRFGGQKFTDTWMK